MAHNSRNILFGLVLIAYPLFLFPGCAESAYASDKATIRTDIEAEQIASHPDQYQGARVRLTCTIEMLSDEGAIGDCGRNFSARLAAAKRLPPLTNDQILSNLKYAENNASQRKEGPDAVVEDLLHNDKGALMLNGDALKGLRNNQTVVLIGIVGKPYSSEVSDANGETKNDLVPLNVQSAL
jgi:hypothetical protein